MNSEKRITPRVEAVGDVVIKLDDTKIKTELVNISNRGMAFLTKTKLKEGDYYFLSFKLPDGMLVSNTKSKIIRVDKMDKSYFSAIAFINITEQSKISINKYIKDQQET